MGPGRRWGQVKEEGQKRGAREGPKIRERRKRKSEEMQRAEETGGDG